MSDTTNTNSASMLGGHAQFAKGYVEETIGNVTGSKEWQESGKNDAKAGVEEMKVCLPTFPSLTLPRTSRDKESDAKGPRLQTSKTNLRPLRAVWEGRLRRRLGMR